MSWRIELTGPARRDLRRLDRGVAARILDALTRLAESEIGDVKRLTGAGPLWRLRVGEWRVLYIYRYESRTLVVRRILPRDQAYRA